MIGYRALEKPDDLPGGFSFTASTAAIEFDNLRREPVGYRTEIQKLIKMIDSVLENAREHVKEPDSGCYWLYGFKPTGLGLLDRAWRSYHKLPQIEVDRDFNQKTAIKEAIEHLEQMRNALEESLHIMLEADECEVLLGICLELSRKTCGYSGASLHY